jgi:hypothetical protein
MHDSPIKRGLLLFGSFIIAYNVSALLHELCHAAAGWFTGNYATGLSIHPFSWSYASFDSPISILTTAAGALGASLIGVILFVCCYRSTKQWLMPVMLMSPMIFLYNGGYWLIDIVMKAGGDACRLIEYGIPSFMLYATALILVISGVLSFIFLIKKMALLTGTFKDRLITLAVGIGTYIAALLTWHLLFNREEIGLWAACAAFGSVLILAMATVPFNAQSKKMKAASWKSIIAIDLIGISIIVLLLMLNPGSGSFPR